MQAMAITRRQHEVLTFIRQFVEERGYSPSFEEIGDGLGLSSLATVHKHVSNLEQKGLLKRGYNRSRSIDLVPPRGRTRQAMMAAMAPAALPLAGRIVAGQPLEADQNRASISLADFRVESVAWIVLRCTSTPSPGYPQFSRLRHLEPQ